MKLKLFHIPMLLLVYWSMPARAQDVVPGKAQNAVGPSGSIKDVREMERSPLNVKKIRPVKAADERELGKEADREREREREKVKMNWNKSLMQRARADVFQFTPSVNTTRPAQPPSSLRLTNQDPAFTFAGNGQDGLIPSDAQGAAGPAHIVVLSNGDARIIDKLTGAVVTDVTLDAFFIGFAGSFDPRIFYDPFGQRFVALALSGASGNCSTVDSKFRLLVSNTSDPTQGWYYYEFDFDGSNAAWLDFAFLGFNKDWIIMNGNSICGTPRNSIYAFPKGPVYQAQGYTFYSWAGAGNFAPAFTYDNTLDRVYLVGTGNPNSAGVGYIDTKHISGNPPVLTNSNSYGVAAPWQAFANADEGLPEQLGSSVKFTASNIFGGSMYQSSVYRNGSLWLAHPIFLPATGNTTRSSTQWWQVNPANGAVQQVGRIDDGSGTVCTFYPSIAVNSQSDAVVSYSIYSPDYYQSAAYNFRNAGDAAGTLPGASFYASGGNINNYGRSGDYNETIVDPNDDNSIWAINQISSASANVFETAVTLIPAYYGCYTDVTFGNNVWLGNTKNEASNSITSAERIQPNANVVYDAGNLVVLSPGFRAAQGSKFRAYINGCGGSIALGNNTERSAPAAAPLVRLSPQERLPAVNGLEAFPNPTAADVTLTFDLAADEKTIFIEVHNASGERVLQRNVAARAAGRQNQALSFAGLPAGLYNVTMRLGSGRQLSTKVVVAK